LILGFHADRLCVLGTGGGHEHLDAPGADLGEFAGPEPDPRMAGFLGGLDANGQPLPMTYRRRRAAADDWIITKATPEGPARLLKAARDMFALGYYFYELVACSNARGRSSPSRPRSSCGSAQTRRHRSAG
jgi:hypothetical protein